ncbi:bifunctional adenosylcobinamide kinase/adenosylcobinamide-phosphate guanylyltransferase [uncultured Clostridium sp.]|uniref:bifunctional adenosylcobinamide kinase/adenosylcobinamide-phosphate guanylyltransferase n=1 Tax=uncultured Clostridium sp. TaxID=59620 RepID=UPI00263680F0|nr:bifunctional adenosylcobinamide kinase/adenosylcobinamide-phosphate guanylyltransferase [uncultured Clostridium sp.]
MKVYFGGSYNGKLNLILEKYNLTKDDIYYCKDEELDFNKKIISGLERYIYSRVIEKKESFNYIVNNREKFKDKIIVVDMISEGVVPIKKEERLWREETGKVMQYLIKESDEVFRVFFGIEKRMK